MMRLRHALSLALALALSAPLALAQQPDGPPRGPSPRHRMGDGSQPNFFFEMRGMWWKNPDLVKSLNITPDQQKKMDDIFEKSRLELIDLKAALEKQEVILHPMLDENPPDTNKVLAQIDKVAQARAYLEKGNARMLLGIRAVLTSDQWTKLHNMGQHRFADRQIWRDRDGHRTPDSGTPAAPPPPTP